MSSLLRQCAIQVNDNLHADVDHPGAHITMDTDAVLALQGSVVAVERPAGGYRVGDDVHHELLAMTCPQMATVRRRGDDCGDDLFM